MKWRLVADVLTSEEAANLLTALHPIMDACAQVEALPSALRGVRQRHGFEYERWDLWTFACALAERSGVSSNYHPARTCGSRNTRTGRPCRQKVRWGKKHCYAHMNPAQLDNARDWQQTVHLPFPRVTAADVEAFSLRYWDRMAKQQQKHVEAQRRQARRTNRDLARIVKSLEKGANV